MQISNLTKDNISAYCKIAVKNMLYAIYKRKVEAETYKIMIREAEKRGLNTGLFHGQLKYCKYDLNEYETAIKRYRKIIDASTSNSVKTSTPISPFIVIDSIKLSYTVPIAYQGVIAMALDLDGNVINDLYNSDPSYRLELCHVCVFPLKDSSRILLFTDKNNRRYSRFRSQIHKLSQRDKLYAITKILFLYTEDMLFSGYLDIEKLSNSELERIARINPSAKLGFNGQKELKKEADAKVKADFSLIELDNLPGLLFSEYGMSRLIG